MRKKLLILLSIVLVFTTTMAYSALSSSLAITSEVHFRPLADIRVNDIAMESANGATIAYESDYSKYTTSSGFVLPTSGASISYRVHVDNIGDVDYSIYDILKTTSDNGLNVSVSGYDLMDVIRAKTSVDLIITYTTTQPSENVINVVNTYDFKKVYRIKYETGTNEVIPDQIKYEGVNLNLTNTVPTKAGYTFSKWHTEIGGVGFDFDSGDTYSVDEDKTFYARYNINTYNINYVLNGGTNDANNPSTYTVETNNITLADATKSGFTFLGWTGNGTVVPTKNLVLAKGSTGDKTFTANFKDETYPEIAVTSTDEATNYLTSSHNVNTTWGATSAAVTFKINATDVGSGIDTIEYAVTDSATPPSSGWTTGANGNVSVTKNRGTYYIHVRATDLEGNTTTVTSKATVVRFRVAYYDDYSKSTSISQSQYYTGTALTTRTPAAVTGYTFDGWYSNTALTTKVVNAGTSYTPTASIKLYGKWVPVTYNITYALNNGTNSANNPSTYTIQSNAITLEDPTKRITFHGNYNATSGANAASGQVTITNNDQQADQTFKGWSGTDLTGDTNKPVTIASGSTGDRSYEAHWTGVAPLKLPKVERTGYTCGWTTSSTGTIKEYDSEATNFDATTLTDGQTATFNLYAVCEANTYNINYTLNGGNNPTTKPTTGTYDADVIISNPTKTFTVNISDNNNATIKNAQGTTVTSASSTQTFLGWSSTTVGVNAQTGSNASSYAGWNGTVKTKNTYFKNLTDTNHGTVTMVANWTPVNVTLPNVTKTGYECKYNTNQQGTGTNYTSGGSYTPSATTNSTTLYVICTANPYNIAYTLNGGTSGTNAPTSGTYDANVVISNPTKTVTITGDANGTGATVGAATSSAQTFQGWSSTTVGTNAQTGSNASSYAGWNGTVKTKNTYFKNLTDTKNATVTMVANWTPVAITNGLPTLTKQGYVCKWYTEATGGSELGLGGAPYTPTANSASAITVFARCSEADDTPYRVNHYVHDLGTNTYTLDSYDDLTGRTNSSVTLANLKKTISGFTYVDGYITGNTTKPSSGAVTTTTILADGSRVINLYYRRNYLYVQYHVNGGSLASTHGAEYGQSGSLITGVSNNPSTNFLMGVYGGKVNTGFNTNTYTSSSNGLHNWNNPDGINIEKTGYTAVSGSQWNTASDGSGTSYGHNASTYDANGFAGADLTTGDKVVTLYVNWASVNYTLTYTLNNGTVTPANPTSYNVESSPITLNNPTKTLTFKGNYNATSGANASSVSGVTIGSNTTKNQTFAGWSGTGITGNSTSVTIPTGSTGNRSYTAHWTAVAGNTPTVTRTGYTCGWSTSSTGTTIVMLLQELLKEWQ